MELTRRDALAVLAAGGAAVSVATLGNGGGGMDPPTAEDTPADDGEGATPDRRPELGDHERETLLGVARVVYPSAVSGIDEFVTTYLDGRASRSGYAAGATEAIERLDRMGEAWHGGRFVDLDGERREQLLRETGADTAEPDPDGSPAERIRYYLLNKLLYALYASPTGGELVGIENPQGYPGGTDSYRRGPPT
jgi:hypothetical protein